MHLSKLLQRSALPALTLGVLIGMAWAAEPGLGNAGLGASSTENSFPGSTRPSDRRLMNMKAGVIRVLNVKPGDRIKKGQVLLVQEVREEVLSQQIMHLEAESEVAVKQAKAVYESKVIERDRVQVLVKAGPNFVSPQELSKAEIDVVLANLDIDKAKVELEQKKLEDQRRSVTVENMKLLAEFDGVVEEVLVRPGEIVDPQKGAMWVVQNNPLWVEVHVPIKVAQTLKAGQMLTVKYADSPTTHEAKIWYFSPVADPATDTQLIRLEMPNPEEKAAGQSVDVLMPEPGKVAAAGAKSE